MNRAPNQVFILLVGLTGAGKSSTVDYLLGTNIGETKLLQSEERSTIEYAVKLKSTKYKIPDIQLSIINTPGLSDTNGLEQDARNIMSIKYFLERNSNIRNRYPNLVMMILNINNNRFTGHSSSLAQFLIGINDINAIDCINPNVVVVLTHAMSIARDPKIWENKVEMKKLQFRAMIRGYLGIDPEIVVLENQPESYDLERDGDCYRLPNGDKQAEIFYQACEKIFINAKDEIGHKAVEICVRTDIDKSVETGTTVSSLSVKTEDIAAIQMLLLNKDETGLASEVFSKLDNYKNQQCDFSDERKEGLNSPVEMDKEHKQDECTEATESIDSISQNDPDQELNLVDKSKTKCSCCLCCFHEDSIVILHNQTQKRMKNVSIGDKILTTDGRGRLTQDEIIAWLHQERDGQYTFLQIVHNLGKITLSPEHILFVGKRRHPKHASSLSPGDELFFFSDKNDHQKETIAIVLSIDTVQGKGIYAPLTYSGRLLVDKVYVSCYSSINPLRVVGKEILSSHALAHVGFLPLRMAFKFGFNINYSQYDDETGIHGYARRLMKIMKIIIG